jgi:hypothetical protein
MTTRARSIVGRPRQSAVSPALFAVIVAAFFLPFGAGAIGGCGTAPEVEFTGLQLATWQIEEVVPEPVRDTSPVAEAVAEYEDQNSPLALIALASAVAGAALGIAGRRGSGVCVGAGLFAIGVLGPSMTGAMEMLGGPAVETLVGYELALAFYAVLVVWHIALAVRRRRHPKRRQAANDTRRSAPSIR